MQQKIIVYGHSFCPMVPPIRIILNKSEIDYQYVNIHQDENARQRVQTINNGNESVPTLIFPDGTSLTEPSYTELLHKLETLGYGISQPVRRITQIFSSLYLLFQLATIAIIVYGVLDFLDIV